MRGASLQVLGLLLVSTGCLAQSPQAIRTELFGDTDAVNLKRAMRAAGDALELYRKAETKALAAKARATS